ncbi:MAG: HAD hydrolase-like protein [Nitriliruptoraceae bacterium]
MSGRLLLFDLDGCLVDSTPAITGSIRHALQQLGVSPPAADTLRWCVGPPLHESFATLLTEPRVDAHRVRAAVDAYRAHYAATSTQATTVIPGIEAALAAVAAEATLAVVTSKPGEVARPILDHLGLAAWFTAVHAPRADHQVEAKAVTLRRALDGLMVGAVARPVMIGDRSHDIEAGRVCGTATVGVTWGAGDREELEAAGADLIVDSPSYLPEAVRSLP